MVSDSMRQYSSCIRTLNVITIAFFIMFTNTSNHRPMLPVMLEKIPLGEKDAIEYMKLYNKNQVMLY